MTPNDLHSAQNPLESSGKSIIKNDWWLSVRVDLTQALVSASVISRPLLVPTLHKRGVFSHRMAAFSCPPLLSERLISAHLYCLPSTSRAWLQRLGPVSHRLESGGGKKASKEGWLGEGGSFSCCCFLRNLPFRNNPTTKPYVYLIPGPGQKGWGEKKKKSDCRKGDWRSHLSVNWSWKQKGSLACNSLSGISGSQQINEEPACRIRAPNQPDIKTQRCNYYPLKLNMCETKKKKKNLPSTST